MLRPITGLLMFTMIALMACSQPVKPLKTEDAGLIAAARTGHAGTVRDMITSGANVNVKDEHGNTPLIEAARNGHDDVVRTLLAAGADSKITNDDGQTALILARLGGHEDVVMALGAVGPSR
ncbi:MAG: ankyrin repeat domain-containing protein [Blastocatellia bacterium]